MTTRLLVVARRFWPHADETCQRLLDWSEFIRQEGIEITILTGRWNVAWPAESACREIPIVRLSPAPRSSWTETLFLRNISSWLSKHHHEFDLIYLDEVASLLHQVAQRNVIKNRGLIARFAGIVPDSASLWSSGKIAQACEGCHKAGWIVTPTPLAQRQLVANGIDPSRIVRITDVAWQASDQNETKFTQLRAAMRNINQDMIVPANDRLLVCLGGTGGLENYAMLVRAITRLLDQGAKVRTWMVGFGPMVPELYDLVKHAGYQRDILFQGPFDALDTVLDVADGLVVPSYESGGEFLVPYALAAGLPFILPSQNPAASRLPDCLQESLLPTLSIEALQISIQDWLHSHQAWLQRAQLARQAEVANQIAEGAKNEWRSLIRRALS